MEIIMNVMRKYWDTVCLFHLIISPFACICAGIYYTFYWSRGFYSHTPLPWLVAFDCSHILYLGIALFLVYEHKKKHIVYEQYIQIVKVFLTVSLLIQYSFIVFLFSRSYTWGCTFLFLALLMLSFDFRMMLFNVILYFILSGLSHIFYLENNFSVENKNYYDNLWFRITIYVLYGILSCAITYFGEKFIKRIQMDENQKNYIFDRQLSYYRNLNLMDMELRKFRHDITNHFLCLQELTDSGDLTALKEYFSSLLSDYSENTQLYFSGNVIIDSILNYDIAHLCHDNVKPVIYGKLPEIVTVSSMDLCTVFSNMLSNALKGANRMTTATELKVQFQSGNRYFSISITNQTIHKADTENSNALDSDDPNEIAKDNRIVRNKKKFNKLNTPPDRNHGYGMLNIHQVIEKYDGIFEEEFNPLNSQFTIQVYLPI